MLRSFSGGGSPGEGGLALRSPGEGGSLPREDAGHLLLDRRGLGLALFDLLLDGLLQIVGGPLELGQALSDGFADLRQLLRSEDEKSHDEDKNQFGHSDGAEHVSP